MVSSRDDEFERGSPPTLREAGIKFHKLSTSEMKKRWPQINFAGVRWGIYELECGYLDARMSCQAVVDAFVSQGGTYRQAAVSADGLETAPVRSLTSRMVRGSKPISIFSRAVPGWGKCFPKLWAS